MSVDMRWPWSSSDSAVKERSDEAVARLDKVTDELRASTLELNKVIDDERKENEDAGS